MIKSLIYTWLRIASILVIFNRLAPSRYNVQSQDCGIQFFTSCSSVYTVISDDTCWLIATTHGIDLFTLFSLNPHLVCDNLPIGSEICLSDLSLTSSSVSPQKTSALVNTGFLLQLPSPSFRSAIPTDPPTIILDLTHLILAQEALNSTYVPSNTFNSDVPSETHSSSAKPRPTAAQIETTNSKSYASSSIFRRDILWWKEFLPFVALVGVLLIRL